MALYLNNLNLNKNQLQKAVVHPLSTAPTFPAVGQVYYDTGDSTIYVCTVVADNSNGDNGTWLSLGGDITGVSLTTGDGTTISDTSGSAAFTIAGGSGITTSSTGSTVTITSDAVTSLGTISQDSVLFTSDQSDDPLLTIQNTSNDVNGARLLFKKDKGAAGADGDEIGEIIFTGDNAAQEQTNYAKIRTLISTAADGTEGGKFEVRIATHDGEMQPGLVLEDGDAEDEIDVTIGRGAASTVTIPGVVSSGTWQGTAIATAYIADDAVTEDKLADTLLAEIDANTAKATNVATDLTKTTSETDVTINSSDGTNVAIGAASASAAGVMTKAVFDAVVLNTAKETNTDISVSVDNLKTALGAGFPLNAVNLGDSGDTITVPGDMTVSGDLTVTGDTITVNTTSLTVKDPLIVIANNNALDVLDTGFYSKYVSTVAEVSATRFTGLFRNSSETGAPYTFFDTTTVEPGTHATTGAYTGVIDIGHTTFKYAPLIAGIITATTNFSGDLSGDVTGDVSGSSGSCTGNAATATKIASITNSNIVQLAGAQTLTGTKTLESFKGTGSVTVTDILDADDMSTASATTLATSESIKAYVDAQGSSTSNTGGRQAFVLAHVGTGAGEVSGNTGSANNNNVFTITHGMGNSRNYGVEVIRNSNNSGGGETVIVDVTRPSDSTIVITFASNVVASDYTALVCKY